MSIMTILSIICGLLFFANAALSFAEWIETKERMALSSACGWASAFLWVIINAL